MILWKFTRSKEHRDPLSTTKDLIINWQYLTCVHVHRLRQDSIEFKTSDTEPSLKSTKQLLIWFYLSTRIHRSSTWKNCQNWGRNWLKRIRITPSAADRESTQDNVTGPPCDHRELVHTHRTTNVPHPTSGREQSTSDRVYYHEMS